MKSRGGGGALGCFLFLVSLFVCAWQRSISTPEELGQVLPFSAVNYSCYFWPLDGCPYLIGWFMDLDGVWSLSHKEEGAEEGNGNRAHLISRCGKGGKGWVLGHKGSDVVAAYQTLRRGHTFTG